MDGVYDERKGLVKFRNCTWFTNLDIPKRHEELVLVRSYSKNPERYPRYDNYDAIEVSKVADIPYDYDGAMGVPITFMDKYNPQQFEIIAHVCGGLGAMECDYFRCNGSLRCWHPYCKITQRP